jgi:hypothetical protein
MRLQEFLNEGKKEEMIKKIKKELDHLNALKKLTIDGVRRKEKLESALARLGIYDY